MRWKLTHLWWPECWVFCAKARGIEYNHRAHFVVIHLVQDVCTYLKKKWWFPVCLPWTKSSGACFPKATQSQLCHLPEMLDSLILCSFDVYRNLCVAIDKDCIYIVCAVVPLWEESISWKTTNITGRYISKRWHSDMKHTLGRRWCKVCGHLVGEEPHFDFSPWNQNHEILDLAIWEDLLSKW